MNPAAVIPCLAAFPACQRTLEFDRFLPGHVNRARRVCLTASGKSINAARALRRLGGNSLVLAFVGGETGNFIRTEVRREGLAADWVEVNEATRYCQTLLDGTLHTATELVEESLIPPARAWDELAARFTQRVQGAPVAVLSGTLPPGAPQDFWNRLIRLATAAGVPVILDSHGEALWSALDAHPLLVKPNLHELARTGGLPCGSPAEIRASARRLVERGAGMALISDGAEAAWLVTAERSWRLQPPRITPVNPIGSGDALAAGLAWALVGGKSPAEAARYGLACATAACMHPHPGELEAARIPELLDQVVLEPQ